ncbi:glycosyltransferase [bacterium]|nr:glycosyltransferase [bacterium]
MKKKVVIIGSRGIPASYGGFETAIEETAVRFAEQGYDVEVHCRSNHYKNRIREFRGVRLRYLPSLKHKTFDTITHTAMSVFVLFFTKADYVMIYGVGNSIFIPFLRFLNVPIIACVDGADWDRAKWNLFAKWFLRMNRRFAAYFSDYYVVDNELLASDYQKRFNVKPVYIPYGTAESKPFDPQVLLKYGLKERDYIIFVGRFVKEKGVDLLIRAYKQCPTEMKLVIIGDNDLDKTYVDLIRATDDRRIIFTGFVYGAEYESLLQKALFYVSASFLEGTSPSLLNAMALNGFALVSDLPENKEVLKGSCATFETGNERELAEKLTYYVKAGPLIEQERSRTKAIVKTYFTWDQITNSYKRLMPL